MKKNNLMHELDDTDYQEYIHGMNHQKIKADHKWGFYQINETRIDWLLNSLTVKNKKDKLINGAIYKEILKRWNSNDFTKVAQDYNTIWTLQGGTIGRATGILSVEEEQKYIQQYQ